MPFPVTKLAYGHRVRLSELSFPAERYNLQVAAGNFNICPPKFQKLDESGHSAFRDVKTTNEVSAEVDLAGVWRLSHFDLGGTNLIKCNENVTISEFDCESLDSNEMKHVILAPKRISLNDCQLSKTFFTKLATMINLSVEDITIAEFDGELSVADLLKLFPHVGRLQLDGITTPLPWFDDLVSMPECRLWFLGLKGTFEALVTFTVDELVAFYQTRGNTTNFALVFTNLHVVDYTDDSNDEVVKFKKLEKELNKKLDVVCEPLDPYLTIWCRGLYKRTY